MALVGDVACLVGSLEFVKLVWTVSRARATGEPESVACSRCYERSASQI